MKFSFFVIILVSVVCGRVFAQSGAAVRTPDPRIHFIRSVSGSSGLEQNGKYTIRDPRTTFYIPEDRHVVVYFEWEGPVGQHHFEGYWKNPQGKVVVMSDFSYETRQKRFAGYWTLDLTDNMQAGMWALEAHVDGELTGTHIFQILPAAKPPSVATARPLLTPSEIYKQAVNASVRIDNVDEKKRRTSTGSGFFIGDGLVATAFQVIEGAAGLRVTPPDGHSVDTSEVVSWNRLQDWAVLKVGTSAPAKLQPAKPKSWSVGDRCFSFDVPTEGNRLIVDESITGSHSFPELGERFNVSSPPAAPAIGSPVLNEYGDVIGVLGGTIFPGARQSQSGAFTPAELREGGMATPIELVSSPSSDSDTKSLAELKSMGLFVEPVVKSELLYGMLGEHFEFKKNEFPSSRESKTEFSRSNSHCEVLLVWNPRSKIRGDLTMLIYDINNHPVVRSKPGKIKGDPGQYVTSRWQVELGALKASAYRVDVLQDDRTVWRSFFRLTD